MTNTDATTTTPIDRAIANLERQHEWTTNLADTYRTMWVIAVGEGDTAAETAHNLDKHRYEGRAMGLRYAIEELRAIREGY